jgi:GntR family transcriptional repressor for pyruvate dehydrogenase complex
MYKVEGMTNPHKPEITETASLFQLIGNKDSLVDRTVKELERLIVGGQLAPGVKLPPERELGEQLGVSRTVIREAIHVLVTKGLLDSRQGHGTVVRRVTRDMVVEPLSLFLRTGERGVSFGDWHRVRYILEVEIAKIAAMEATSDDVARLKQIMAEMRSSQDNPGAFAEWDTEFHSMLAEMTHNPLLVVLDSSVLDLLHKYLKYAVPRLDPRLQVIPYHEKILERVEAKDSEGAARAMREHLDAISRQHDEFIATALASDEQDSSPES